MPPLFYHAKGGNTVSELQSIKEKAMGFMMSLSNPEMKYLNNHILRPLYKLINQQADPVEAVKSTEVVQQLENDLQNAGHELLTAWNENVQLQEQFDCLNHQCSALQNEIENKDQRITDLEQELLATRRLAETKTKLLERVISVKDSKKKVNNV